MCGGCWDRGWGVGGVSWWAECTWTSSSARPSSEGEPPSSSNVSGLHTAHCTQLQPTTKPHPRHTIRGCDATPHPQSIPHSVVLVSPVAVSSGPLHQRRSAAAGDDRCGSLPSTQPSASHAHAHMHPTPLADTPLTPLSSPAPALPHSSAASTVSGRGAAADALEGGDAVPRARTRHSPPVYDPQHHHRVCVGRCSDLGPLTSAISLSRLVLWCCTQLLCERVSAPVWCERGVGLRRGRQPRGCGQSSRLH